MNLYALFSAVKVDFTGHNPNLGMSADVATSRLLSFYELFIKALLLCSLNVDKNNIYLYCIFAVYVVPCWLNDSQSVSRPF